MESRGEVSEGLKRVVGHWRSAVVSAALPQVEHIAVDLDAKRRKRGA